MDLNSWNSLIGAELGEGVTRQSWKGPGYSYEYVRLKRGSRVTIRLDQRNARFLLGMLMERETERAVQIRKDLETALTSGTEQVVFRIRSKRKEAAA